MKTAQCMIESRMLFLYSCVSICCILISYGIYCIYSSSHTSLYYGVTDCTFVIFMFLYHTYAMPTMLMN